MRIDGRFWLTKENENFLGNGRVELLEQIEKTGSISGAAKAMKMSYKAAWERINQMNQLSDSPIIYKVIGGKGGGGTVLTPYAYELIATFKSFEKLHRQFMERFAEAGDDPERLARILSRTFLTTSARNQLSCQIISIKEHGINGSIELQLGSETFWADITVKSIRSMGLTKGCSAYAIIKSSDVVISDNPSKEDSSLNIFQGQIQKIESIDEKAEITLNLSTTEKLIGVIPTQESKSLVVGSKAYASIAKHNIIIGL